MRVRKLYIGLSLTALTASLALSGMSTITPQTSLSASHVEASASIPKVHTAESINAPVVGMATTANGGGYWLVGKDGGVYTFGNATFHGSTYSDGLTGLGGAHPLNGPIAGMAATPDGGGYWLVGADGGVYAFGNAGFYGSTYSDGLTGLGGAHPLDAKIVAIVPTPNGGGYWLIGADGGVFSFGNAGFYGSTYSDGLTGLGGAHPLGGPIVSAAAAPNGAGYWMVGADGGIYSFGAATFHGSTYSDGLTGLGGPHPLNGPIIGMAATPDGGGYWLVGKDGGVYTFGNAQFDGSTYSDGITGLGGPHPLSRPIVGIGANGTDGGYWLGAADGGIFTFGSAHFYGSVPGIVPPASPSPQAGLNNPASNLPDTFDAACYSANLSAGPNSFNCQVAALEAINQAHADEGLPGLQLPSNYYSLSPAEQLFVLVNEERIERGLPPAVGLVAGLSEDAQVGADTPSDPPLGSPLGDPAVNLIGPMNSNWAGDYSVAASVFDWMYNDGWGGSAANTSNFDCTSATAPGCWGHRDNILYNFSGGTIVMGAATADDATDSHLASWGLASTLISATTVLGTVPSPSSVSYTYTWADAVAAGA